MTDKIQFSVRKVFKATEAQKNVGIFATFNMTIDVDDGIMLSLSSLKLMKSREGQWYIASPSTSYDGKDENGNPVKRRIDYIKFWPEEKNWPKKDAIVRLVLAEIENMKSNGGNPPAKAPSKPAPKAATPANDPW